MKCPLCKFLQFKNDYERKMISLAPWFWLENRLFLQNRQINRLLYLWPHKFIPANLPHLFYFAHTGYYFFVCMKSMNMWKLYISQSNQIKWLTLNWLVSRCWCLLFSFALHVITSYRFSGFITLHWCNIFDKIMVDDFIFGRKKNSMKFFKCCWFSFF